jgi:uncharacterized repeat protein (TIGR01451 family)
MTFLRRSSAAAAGFVLMLALACGTATAQVDRGDLVLTGGRTPEPAGGGGQVTYTINVKNDSTVTATGVAVTMGLPNGAQLVSCTTGNPPGQPCQEAPVGIVTATFATIKAHKAAKVTLKVTMPAVSQETIVSLMVLAHADSAIGGEEPRDGNLTLNSTILPPTSRLLMSPSGRTVQVACGGTIDSATFGTDSTGQLLDGLVCINHAFALTFTAGGKTLHLGGKKIFSGQRVTGNAGIIVGPNSSNVTIDGGGVAGTMGIEQFEYCIKDLGGNTGLHVTSLRCFRAKAAGILTLSNGVLIDDSLIDNTVPDSQIEVAGGGIGIQAGGDNLHVKDTKVRRSRNIGLWAYGVDTDGSGRVVTYDGNTTTSRIESNAGIGVLFSGGPHELKDTQVQGDDSQAGTSLEGIVVAPDALGVSIDSVVIKKHHGDAIRVQGGAIGTVIARTTVEDIGGRGFVIDAPSTLTGNSAALVSGDAFVVNTTATLTSNTVEQCLANGFVINAGALIDGNSAKDNEGYGFVLTNSSPGSAAPEWTVQGIGDFDGSGNGDILWRHTSGLTAIWLMNATGTGLVATSTYGVGTDWSIQGVGDVNGDGKADIVWRHASGLVSIWLMNGTSISSTGSPTGVTTDWSIQDVGDFNGDSKADILWRHSSGLVYIWLMDGLNISTAGSPAGVGSEWSIQGVGDLNGDGKADIVWRHASGLVTVWLMNGTSISSTGSPAGVGTDWSIHGVGDVNGNGKADLVWRHTSGAVTVWLMDGANIIGTGSPGSLGTDWIVQDVGDLNHDGKADILWRRTSGELTTWFMNGTGLLSTSGVARLRTNTAEGSVLGGFLVNGNGNILDDNDAKDTGGRGFDVTGSGNDLNTNKAEDSAGPEFLIGPGNLDSGSNTANGATFSFTAAGGTFE